MENMNNSPQPVPTGVPRDDERLDKRGLVERMYEARANFAKDCAEYTQFSRGYTQRLYAHYQFVFGMDEAFRRNQDERSHMTSQEYFNCNRQKPDENSLLRHLLYFLVDARTDVEREKWLRPAIVLEHFRNQGVPVDRVAQRLREAGGYARIYKSITAKTSTEKAVGDDLALLLSDPDLSEDHTAFHLSLPEAVDGSDEPTASNANKASPTIMGQDAHQSDKTSESGVEITQDQRPLGRGASRKAATETGDANGGQFETAGPPKRCPLHSAAKKDHVAVRVEPWEVSPALAGQRVIFFADVIQPNKAGGHVDVVARRVIPLNSADGPWPDLVAPGSRNRNESPDEAGPNDEGNEVLRLPELPRSAPVTVTPRAEPALALAKRTSRTPTTAATRSEVHRNPAKALTDRAQAPAARKQVSRSLVVAVESSRTRIGLVRQERPRRPIDARAESGLPRRSTP
jgi:hypothetical protein